ncbi:P-loop containing nucleoside triphosphate hydrolase protein [Phaeosphaeriaceae sp. PMI808]|nr:P-loop containing nucleoside triphosphate hydrolase protein [Phaeosphaeriaceae sp. PMI808]
MASQDTIVMSPPSSHRLPTVSASQALQNLHTHGARTVSTGITQLNKLLIPHSLPGHHVPGGYMRGKVTEIFGPPGVGKTSLGIQATANALHQGQRVVWVDAACAPLPPQRLLDVFSASRVLSLQDSGTRTEPPSGPFEDLDQVRGNFLHFTAPTLAHLLALFMHPPASFPPQNTSLFIIDSLSTLIDNSYPRNVDARNRTEQSRWAAGRRFTMINELISTFSRFTALHDIALIVTCQTITRIRGASRALLVPAISGVEWENGVSTRLVLFRDWVRQEKKKDTADADRLLKTRFAGLVKVNGVSLADDGGVGSIVPFAIEDSGLHDISIATDDITAPMVLPMLARTLKRSYADIEGEASEEPNSDELYGWIEDDEVAAEGLLIDDTLIADADIVDTAESQSQGRSNKMARPSAL